MKAASFLWCALAAALVFFPARAMADQGPGPLSVEPVPVFAVTGYKLVSPAKASQGCLALKLSLSNPYRVRKIDLTSYRFLLKDEYGNVYRRLPPPAGYSSPEAQGRPQSLYPGKTISRTIFFEPPVKPNLHLVLSIFTSDAKFRLGLLAFRYKPVVPVPPKRAKPQPPLPRDNDLRLVYPAEGTQVAPGGSVYVRLEVSGGLRRPDKVLVIAPQSIFNDVDRKLQYRIRISPDQPPGPLTYVFIAQWDRNGQPVLLSRSLQLVVRKQ